MVGAARMKTVFMDADFYYQPHRKLTIWFQSGNCYTNVPDAAAAAIEAAGKGTIYTDAPLPDDCIDYDRAWKQLRHRAPPGRASWHQARQQ